MHVAVRSRDELAKPEAQLEPFGWIVAAWLGLALVQGALPALAFIGIYTYVLWNRRNLAALIGLNVAGLVLVKLMMQRGIFVFLPTFEPDGLISLAGLLILAFFSADELLKWRGGVPAQFVRIFILLLLAAQPLWLHG